MSFDSDRWLEDRKNELVNLMFQQEFGISDFRHTVTVINFDDLQSPQLIKRIDHYRKALRAFFSADEIRSLLDYYYSDKDKKPLLNLIKQLLRHYGYRLHRVSEYQGNVCGTKLYKSRYTIIQDTRHPTRDAEVAEVDDAEVVDDAEEVDDAENTNVEN